jgi:molecular chaperone GrpE
MKRWSMPSSPESEPREERPAQAAPASEQQSQGADPRPGPEQPPDVEELIAELQRSEDRYKRALADLDNYRKRTAREIETRVLEAKESLIRDWLEALDSVERAMRMQHDGPCVDGLRAVLDQMDAILARQGARRIGSAGDQFDPERHEAIAVHPSTSVPDRTVIAIERAGFTLGDRVIRPAQVVVARAPEHAH